MRRLTDNLDGFDGLIGSTAMATRRNHKQVNAPRQRCESHWKEEDIELTVVIAVDG